MSERKNSLSGIGRELLPHALWDGIKEGAREVLKSYGKPGSLFGMILPIIIGFWRTLARQPAHWYILGTMFIVFLGCFIWAIKTQTPPVSQKASIPTPSLKVYLDDCQYGVRILWLDKTFLFLNCRILSPSKTTSIVGIDATVISSEGTKWAGSLIENLSAWYLTHDMGGDSELEDFSLWKKLKDRPLQKEVQENGWLGIVIQRHLSKEELAGIPTIELSIEDGGGNRESISLPVKSTIGKMIVAKHVR